MHWDAILVDFDCRFCRATCCYSPTVLCDEIWSGLVGGWSFVDPAICCESARAPLGSVMFLDVLQLTRVVVEENCRILVCYCLAMMGNT